MRCDAKHRQSPLRFYGLANVCNVFFGQYDLVFYELIDFGVATRRAACVCTRCAIAPHADRAAQSSVYVCVCVCRIADPEVGRLKHSTMDDIVATIILIIIFVTFVFRARCAHDRAEVLEHEHVWCVCVRWRGCPHMDEVDSVRRLFAGRTRA